MAQTDLDVELTRLQSAYAELDVALDDANEARRKIEESIFRIGKAIESADGTREELEDELHATQEELSECQAELAATKETANA